MKGSQTRELEAIVRVEDLPPVSLPRSWLGEGSIPPVLVAPESESQVAAVLERASQEGWRVRPAGHLRAPLGGGESSPSIILSTRNLRKMVGYEPADLTFTAQAGMQWTGLQETTRERGQWLPLDPPGVRGGTLGGVVATGLSGPLRQAYGAPRDHILGLTLISGDGRVLKWGGRVVKNVAGFDITRLTVGSWGALGVVTAVSARLFPLPEADLTVLVRAPTLEDLLPLASSMALSNLPFSAVELLEPLHPPLPGGAPDTAGTGGAALVLRFLASEAQAREVEDRIRKEVASEASNTGGSIATLWGEESADVHRGLEEWGLGSELVLRLSLLPSGMKTLLEEARSFAEICSAHTSLAAHMGWGVLRVALSSIPAGGDGFAEVVRRIVSLRARLEAAGGSLVVSAAPEALFREVGCSGTENAVSELVRGLRAEFDPAGILSAGRPLGGLK